MPRKQSQTVQLKLRMKEPLRAAVEKSAKKRGVSLNTELVDRIERSFEQDRHLDQALGGPEMRRTAELMISAFGHNGNLMAAALGHPEWTAAEWMADESCYRAAVLGVVEALLVARPNAGWDRPQVGREVEAVKGRILTWLVRAGRIQTEEGSGQ